VTFSLLLNFVTAKGGQVVYYLNILQYILKIPRRSTTGGTLSEL